ncbi:uncharacterized protein M6B38_175565 [Iris pallida]|uniref:Uncharacterized protein n=1 Tax=Iris pallida TaxID=29817 RepID=A0AAX6EQX5_IRIPA|nr:uncharacterized protein M6B38_175565 [Iris pallida]
MTPPPFLAILLLLFLPLHALFLPFNSSIPSPTSTPTPTPSPFPSILEDVVKSIVAKEHWDDPDAEIRVSNLNPQNSRIGISQSYEFHVRSGRTSLVLRFSDPVDSWRRPVRDFGPDLGGIGSGEDPRPAVGLVELEGPLDLRAGDDELSLSLPALNVTHKGLRRVFVADGITIKIEGAEEVSLFHPHDIGLSQNRCSIRNNQDDLFSSLGLPSCAPLLLVRVAGPALLVASRTRNSRAYIESSFHSHDTIQLLSEKCFSNGHSQQIPSCSFGSLSSKLVALEEIPRSFLGSSILRSGRSPRLLRAKITSTSLVKFRLELERSITENDRKWKKVAEWRTKPVVERVWFEILARIEEGKGLKQVLVRKLTRPITIVESSPWSNLMSNLSFTEFPFIVLPPEELTLDVKW